MKEKGTQSFVTGAYQQTKGTKDFTIDFQ